MYVLKTTLSETNAATVSLQNRRIGGASAIHERARNARPEKSAIDFSGLALRARARVSCWPRQATATLKRQLHIGM